MEWEPHSLTHTHTTTFIVQWTLPFFFCCFAIADVWCVLFLSFVVLHSRIQFSFYIIHFNSFPFLNDKMSFLHNEDKNKCLGYRIAKALSKSKADILFTLEVKKKQQQHTNVDERSKEISREMKQKSNAVNFKAVHCVYLIRICARACLPLHFLCGILCALPYLSILATL